MAQKISLDEMVEQRIKLYQPKNGLDRTAEILLTFCGINHPLVKEHNQRVGLLAEAVAIELGWDAKAALFAGLVHDSGKLTINSELFDGHDITQAEYEIVKGHAPAGFEGLRKHHLFVALCAGYHHAMCYHGYGLTADDFPKDWHMGTIKKILITSGLLSVCDFIDAHKHRKTKLKDGSDKPAQDLKGMLYAKYPDDHAIIDIALAKNSELGFDTE